MTRGSIVVIPLWLMKTLGLKEATWFAQDYTTERCRRDWKPGGGAPRFTLTHFSKLTRETLAWASKPNIFSMLTGSRASFFRTHGLGVTKIPLSQSHQKAHFTD